MALGGADGVGERHVVEWPSASFESGPPREFLETPRPGRMCGRQNALQRVRGNAHLLAVSGQEVLEVHPRVVDSILGIQLDLSYGPIPDAREMEEPGVKGSFLRRVEPQFDLILDHGEYTSHKPESAKQERHAANLP